MREHEAILFRVQTSQELVFYVLACCMGDAIEQAEEYCDVDIDERGVPVAVHLVEGPLIVVGDDAPDPDEDDAAPPITVEEKKSDKPQPLSKRGVN